MRVTRLDIFGFKSFMERLILPLESGITGIVGPNGCGKSNVVDALRWVLGETRASNLRGGVLEDVIFNGTDKFRPLGLAEVTITLRANEDNFFADLISPQLEVEKVLRSLEAEFKQDSLEEGGAEDETPDRPVKLRVIAGNLGVKTEEVIHAPEEATDDESIEMAQEAAKDEAELATTILTRFSWLKSVNEVQVTRRLYRSGESEFFINRVPCRLKDIKDFFRAIGLGARAYTVVAQGEVSRIVTAKPEERRLIIEEAAGVIGFRDKIAAADRKLEETGVNIARLRDVIGEVDRQVGSLKRQAARAQNRQKLKDEITERESALFKDRLVTFDTRYSAAKSGLEDAQGKEVEASALLQTTQLREESCRSELVGVDVEGDALRSRIDTIREELLHRSRRRGERISRINELRAYNLARGTEIKRLEERRGTLLAREVEATREVADLEQKDHELSERLRGIEVNSEDDLKKIATELRELREKLRTKEGELRSHRDKLISAQSNLNAINEQIIAASPLNQLKKTLEGEGSEMISGLVSQVKLFIEGLSIPGELARAVQAVLAERAAFLVSENPHQIAEAFVSRAYGSDTDKKKRLGVGILRAGGEESSQPRADVPFSRLVDQLSVHPDFTLAASRLLSDVYVATSAEDAFFFFANNPGAQGITIVTHEGDLVTDHSFYSLRHEGGIVQLKNRASEYQVEIASLEEVQLRLQGEREEAQRSVSTCEERQSEILRESERRQAELRDVSNHLANVRGRLHAERRVIEQIGQDLGRILSQVQELDGRIAENKKEEERLQEELESGKNEADVDLEREAQELGAKYSEIDGARKQGREQLSHLANEVHRARQMLDAARSSVSSMMLEEQKLELERENIRARVLAEYGEEFYEGLVSTLRPEDALNDDQRSEFEDEVLKLRNRIAREGEVDSTSIERYEEENKRLEELEKQLSDLEEAALTLKKTIARLTEISVQRFVAMYEAVNKNFSRLIPQLFGGGKGALELSDPSNPLESGVDILVRPPGKKPKSIELLSGGEKALCATALIFAMFLEKPSPLCVLDEVDAPLDEANLMRFLQLVKQMSDRTQFMIITHNKQTMNMADNLIGVTMQEPGASRVISVSLQEAYSQVA